MAPCSRLSVVALAAALLLPAALVFTMNASAQGDLSISSTVVVQVVPEPRGIVANKSAALRLTVVSTFPEEVLANISVTYNHSSSQYIETGPHGNGVPIAPGVNIVYVPGGNCTAYPTNWPSDPPALLWTSAGPDSGIMAEIDSDDSVGETDESNNVKTTDSPMDVWAPHTLRILVVPLLPAMYRYIYDYRPFEFSLEEEFQELLEMYPIADDGLEVVQAPPRYDRFDPSHVTTCREVTLNLSAEARMLGYDRVIAVIPYIRDMWGIDYYGCAAGVLQEPRDPVPIYVTGTGIDAREALVAHELGHTYYLWHPHDIGLSLYNATRWSVGDREYGLISNTFMCYPDDRLPAGVPLTPRWVDVERYHNHTKSYIDLSRYSSGPEGTWEWNLFSQLVNTPPMTGPIVLIEGSILKTGQAVIDRPWFVVPKGVFQEQIIPQQGPVGSYAVRMLDSVRNQLGVTYFNASFSSLFHDEGVEDMYSSEESDSAEFVINAPYIVGTKYVQIVDPSDNVLAEREVSISVPTVEILAPDGGANIEIGQNHEISWTGEDLDGDTLTYFVSYTADDGDAWIPIASNITASSYLWNTSGIAPTSECRVRVMASDGFNTGEDVSDAAFEMTDSSPPTTRVELNGTLGDNGWYVSGVNASLIALDSSRVSSTEYFFDNGTWITYTSSIQISVQGVRTLYFRSQDLAGNVEPVRSATVRIDLVGPEVSMIYPLEGASLGDNRTFSWIASDAVSGLVNCEVRLNSGAWTDVGTSRQWEADGLVDGLNTFEVRATDAAGNVASISVEFSYREPSGTSLWLIILAGVAVVAVGTIVGIYYWRKNRG